MRAFVLIAFLVPLPAIAVGVLLAKLVAVVVTRRVVPERRPTAWAQAAVLLGCVAVLGYSAGVWFGHFFDLAATSELCPDGPLGDPALVDRLVPLRNSCKYADGTTADLVPTAANPLALWCTLAAADCAALAIVAARSERVAKRQELTADT